MRATRTIWTPEMDAWLRANYATMRNKELASHLGVSHSAIHARQKRLRLSKPVIWTAEAKARLAELYPDRTNAELAKIFGSTERGIGAQAFVMGLRKSERFMREKCMATAFRKGHVPFNKGKKWEEFMSEQGQAKSRKTCFKKGQVPPNRKEVGSERIDCKDGYTLVKVGEGINQYRLKHRVIWEQHNGPLPDGFVVCLKDGDKTNFDISNLEMKSRAEHGADTVAQIPIEIKRLISYKGHLKRQLNAKKK